MLDRQDERELVIAAQSGDQKAMLRLINAHEPMIGRIVRQWRPRDPEDLHTHLVLTFIETLPRFQVEKGFRVSTYLRWYLIEAARHLFF
jgi:DNA-directed RNA polymerase specialized sigma subunit